MYRNKKDVDKHVENLQSKLPIKEFKTRAFSIARLYFDVGDYANCQKYVEQYLTQKDNNAAAYKLLGQALQKLGHKDKALDHYKTSLDIDPTQTSTILDICELLADDGINIEPGRAQYWCEKAEAIFPRHPITFTLREKLVALTNPDPEALVKLLTTELIAKPKDASLHARLLKHYLNINQNTEAFEHGCKVEFSRDNFINNYAWYEVLNEVLNRDSEKNNVNWLYQLLLLTVRERLCALSLIETPSGSSKSVVETNELLHAYDQSLQSIATAGAPAGFAEFHASLLQHHRGQFAFHTATFLLKKAKKDQLSWRDAVKVAAPLMLIAWQTVALDSEANWLKYAPEKILIAVNRWYTEGTYRCSQAGHYLISNYQDKNKSILDQVSQCCSGTHWKDKLYAMIFSNRNHLAKINTSHFVSDNFNAPILRFPTKLEVEAYDVDAQKQYGNSLHHFVWILLNYKNYAHFKCTLFDMLIPTATSCGPETLNKLDIHAFLYCAALTTRQQKANEVSYVVSEKPNTLPANITDLLCPVSQMKWWDCAYKFSQSLLGTEFTDIRATLSRGIEVVRCIDNHGLDGELLCTLGRIFSERAKTTTSVDEKSFLELRACLYYRSAIPLLEKLKSKIMVKVSDKRMFDYTHTELDTRELNNLLEESKLYLAINHFNDCEYDKAIEILANVKSVQAYYQLAQTYKKIAELENNSSTDGSRSKNAALLAKAKHYAYKALDILKDTDNNKNNSLYTDAQVIIEDIEVQINKIDPDLSNSTNDVDGRYSSDENVSYRIEPTRNNNHMLRNLSSTPKASNSNTTNYRTAIDSQILEMTRIDQKHLERIEKEIKNLQKKDTAISDFMTETKNWFDENRKLGNKIMTTINSNIQNTTDQFKQLKISVDQVKDQIDECKNECKDVGDLKKQIHELKKEVDKLKKSSSEQPIDQSELYNLDEEYRTNESSNYAATHLPFPSQILPQFNQRPPFPLPPNPYQLYNQSLYNLYSQYPQFAQPTSVPGGPSLFDATRGQMNFPGVYPTPDQMYLDVAHLIPPTVPQAQTVPGASAIPAVSVVPTLPQMPAVTLPTSIITTKTMAFTDSNEVSRSLPVNVVITSSDPLPTCASTPAPILSITIPPKHIKGTPHNYQIAMPTSSEAKIVSPPVFSFSMPDNKAQTSTSNWKQTFQSFNTEQSPLYKALQGDSTLDNSKSVVDGPFSGASPNTSLNKSRTLSEKSNTSVDNYDPCPDFKPIVPLPAEVKVTTGEEDEVAIFSSRAKLFRFVDKQWKERGIGEMKLLKHKVTGKVRVLMRREQIHKICANHIITSDMEIQPVKNETKAYFWIANDFAEETIVLEKFSIRFKTADIGKDFYNAFEKARQEAKITAKVGTSASGSENKINSLENNTKDKSSSQQFIQNETNTIAKETTPATSTQNKAVVGGFTFSGTPIFKPVESDKKSSEPTTDLASKSNVFSGLTFKSSTSSPFSNIFSVSAPTTTPDVQTEKQDITNKQLNVSDSVEEFEPSVEFKPVIPLPALVDQKTGEEDEQILFEHRAKLLRFDSNTKEWKERGLGIIKLLVHKNNNQKIRLLMRREQIMKVCCNHAVTKEMTFQKMPNVDKAVTWCAKDFSEGELVPETFCLRFKTVTACDGFIGAIQSAQSKLKDDTKAAKEEQNAAKQINQSGFGDKFKAKPGSWQCDSCYTNNLENFVKCACCEQPKPMAPAVSTPNKSTSSSTSSWGDKFKSKPGSWECQSCFVRNEANLTTCSACNSPKDPTAAKAIPTAVKEISVKFSFGIPSQSTTSVLSQSQKESNGFGDKFKPKVGSWECKQCFVRNDGAVENCVACNSSKDPNAPKKTTGILETPANTAKFRFGIPTTTNDEKTKVEPVSIFDGTGAHNFSFGIPSTTTIEQKPTGVIFAAPKSSSDTTVPINFGLKKSEETTKVSVAKQPLLPTPKTEANSFANKESGEFGFVFKMSDKSPAKSLNKSQGDESDGEDYIKEEDCHAHFNPVIPMPDKVDVVTGEENEAELYSHRARLYRFVSSEWKERGTGIVKILKHNETNKLRVIMRREQVLKICLNHALTPEIIYKPKDEKSWLFAANDFSEGELTLQQLCIRFQNKDIALQFKEAVDNALGRQPVSDTKSQTKTAVEEKDSDVVFVSETQASEDEKKKAKELMLPENFYTYKHKEPCKGCRGCIEDGEVKSEQPSSVTIKAILSAPPVSLSHAATTPADTPVKSTFATFQSPTTSIYGTPTAMEKTIDTSIFRTPLGSTGTNTKSSTPSTNNDDPSSADARDKENIFTQKPFGYTGTFGNFGEKTLFGTPINSSLFSSEDFQSATNTTKSSLIAQPKLNTTNTTGDNKTPDPKSLFASAAATSKPVFGAIGTPTGTSIFGNAGLSANKSVMGVTMDTPKEVKSLFGNNDQKPLNIFSGSAQGSLFGPGSLGTQSKPISSFSFGLTSTSQNEGVKSIFSSNTSDPSSFWKTSSITEEKKPDIAISADKNDSKDQDQKSKDQEQKPKELDQKPKEKEPETKEAVLKIDNGLSFADLSTSGPGFGLQKKADFQWEGAGQPLFSAGQKAASKGDKNTSGASEEAGADEEYDPHYEPIVPLPEKIVVTTGEEDEEKVFGERCKLYRYDEKSREWKERGVGEIKILHHPLKKTYRLLLRREQVHKAVLNMLLFMELELLPMKNSDRAWTWVGRNFAENPAGEQETLAVRFKSIDLANSFRDNIVQCTRKLQAAAATAIREEQEAKEKGLDSVAPLRLPKHLADSARADSLLSAAALQAQSTAAPAAVVTSAPAVTSASVFGSAKTATPASVFGSAPTATPASVFGSAPTATPASVFGSALTATPASVFGSALTATPASVFGSASTATAASVFGSTPTATPASVFGSTPTATPASVFGSTPTATPASVFGSASKATPASVFGSTPTATPASVFGSVPKATSASVFGSAPTTSPASVFNFASTATPASVFGSALTTSATPAATPASVFTLASTAGAASAGAPPTFTFAAVRPPPATTTDAPAEPEHPESEHDEYQEEDDEDYDHEYYQDYEGYDDEETYYSCSGAAVIRPGAGDGPESSCSQAHIQVLFDQDTCAPRILVSDPSSGALLADMLIHSDTHFQMEGDSCAWSGLDYTSDEPVEKSVTVNFYDSYTAMQFYDSCETSKTALAYSNDPES